MVKASLMICGAIAVAFCGSPSVSNGFSCTWQPGLAALCLSMASWTPFLMLMPSAASGPLSAPAIAIDTGGQVALPSPAGSAGGVHLWGAASPPLRGIGGPPTLVAFALPAVLVDLYLLDDLQLGLSRLLFRLGLVAPGNAEHDQTRTTESKYIPYHASAHAPPPNHCFHRHQRTCPGRPGRRCFGKTIANG